MARCNTKSSAKSSHFFLDSFESRSVVTVVMKLYEIVWMRGIGRLLALFLILPIRIYQLTISPLLGDVCRYHPSCSKYAVGALNIHGPFKGLVLIAYRLVRCTPFTRGGIDYVPTRGEWRSTAPFLDQPPADHR
jgi:putative membrane protein insertion efficiency factor